MGSKGGIAILVAEEFKNDCVLIHEGKEAEILAIKVCSIYPNLCLINYYGRQENTTPPGEICNHLSEVVGLATRLSEEGNLVVLAGDFNVSIGNQVLQDNHPVVSRGGKLLTDLLDSSGDLVMENPRYEGDSVTHLDASGGGGKCLDFVICNSLADERIEEFMVDEERIVTPFRYLHKSGTRTYTDHLSVYWEMKVEWKDEDDYKPIYVWNYSRPLGDGRFAYFLDKSVNKLVSCANQNKDINVVFNKMRKEENNARHRGYGRREVNPKRWEHIEEDRIERFRLDEIKKVVERIREDGKNHRVPLQIFATRKSHILAERGSMFSSIKHPETGRMVETRKEVYQATIRHNEITLQQNENQPECYRELAEFKRSYVEWAKTVESTDPKDETIYLEEFLETVKELQARNKTCYAEFKKWGPKFRVFVYWMMKRIYETEQIPEEFMRTKLQALYKNKGARSNLGNYRFLHLKEGLAKLFETIVMKKIKADMWKKFPISQIGGLPSSRTTEHLYLIITMMLMFENQCEWTEEGVVIIFKDVMKAFDKVSAEETVYAAAEAGVKGKNLRVVEAMNSKTTFTVIGDPEETEFEKEWVGGQGTVFTCTACSLAMPMPMKKNIDQYERETGIELGVRVGPNRVLIEEVDFVDDEGSFANSAETARTKGKLISRSMDEINVKVHPLKTRYMILGTEEFKTRVGRELEEEPIVIQGFKVERSYSEKYLGMLINAAGSRETVKTQMEARVKECKGKMVMIKDLMERPTMKEFGYLAGIKTLFESICSSTALYSAGTWAGLKKKEMEWFDREQKQLWYSLLRLNSKTTWLQVCWECDILPWSWGIVREKLSLVSFLHHGKISQSGRIAVSESTSNWKLGLVEEARQWARKLNLPDPTKTNLSAEVIGDHVKEAAREEMWESVVSSRYIRLEVKTENFTPEYFFNTEMTDHEQLLWFSYRLGILEFRRRFRGKYRTVNCIYGCAEDDTLEHSKICKHNPVKLRGQSTGELLSYLKELHSERLSEVGIGLHWL